MLKRYFPFVIFFYLIVLGNIYAQTTAIPDANFEQALIDLGIDKDGTVNQSIANADIAGILSLDIKTKNISDLTGIEGFSSLIQLNCSNNQLTSLNINLNLALTTLRCTDNQLTSLNVSPALTNLVLYNNLLTSIDISQNTALTNLSCTDNKLTSLDVTQNPALEFLYCSNNQLTSLDLSQNTTLDWLYCGGNQLTSLDVSQNTVLGILNCSYNQLASLDISQNPSLGNLDCSNNQLTSFNLNQTIGDLTCSNNLLTSLDLSQNTNLYLLGCEHNQLTNLDLSKTTILHDLYCNDNQLTTLNVKNGNNENIQLFNSVNNPQLQCIQIDNETAANANQWPYDGWQKDATTNYSEDCENYLGVDDELLTESLKLYPNPVSDILTVNSKLPLTKIEIYSILGQRVKDINSDFNSISTNYLSSGIYMIKIYSEKGITFRKLIKQ